MPTVWSKEEFERFAKWHDLQKDDIFLWVEFNDKQAYYAGCYNLLCRADMCGMYAFATPLMNILVSGDTYGEKWRVWSDYADYKRRDAIPWKGSGD